jgi:hypothetical protein
VAVLNGEARGVGDTAAFFGGASVERTVPGSELVWP